MLILVKGKNMITYIDGDKEAIIVGISENLWVVEVHNSFSDFVNRSKPIEVRSFTGTPNRFDILKAWPGWTPRVRDDNNWAILPDSTDDLPLLSEVPKSVTARQIRLWLIQHNFNLSQIETAINNIEDTLIRETVRIEWEYAPYIERSHPWLAPLAQSLGLNEEQIDQAFREASLL